MIEAVNSVVSNAPLVRGNAEQVSAARSYAASPEVAAQAVARIPQAPYISPYISLDVNYDKAVLLIRDSETGDVLRQFPSESRLQQVRRSADAAGGVFVQAQSGDVTGVTTPDASADTGGDVPATFVAEAQQASAALAAGARTGVESLSAGVSVLA